MMIKCPWCSSTLIQREYDGDITCLFCSRTLTRVPVGLPHVSMRDLHHRTTPRPVGRKQRYD